jgi:hypothetical protein
VLVPLGGLGTRLDAMHDWHRAKGIEAMRGRSRRDESVTTTFAGALLIQKSLKHLRVSLSKLTWGESARTFVQRVLDTRLLGLGRKPVTIASR